MLNVSLGGADSYRVRVTGPSACPACGASVRPDAPWCTLCYADLRPAPAPVAPPAPPEPVPVAAPEPDALAGPLAGPPAGALPPVSRPTWPCTVCGTANSLDLDLCAGCGAGFMAAARDDAPLLELPVVGDITRLGRGQRFALAAGVVLAIVLLTFLLGLILG